MCSTANNLWTFTGIVHFELPFWRKGTDKIHTEGLSKFHSNIFSILFVNNGICLKLVSGEMIQISFFFFVTREFDAVETKNGNYRIKHFFKAAEEFHFNSLVKRRPNFWKIIATTLWPRRFSRFNLRIKLKKCFYSIVVEKLSYDWLKTNNI